MKIQRKILAVLVAVCLLLTAAPVSVLAADGGWTYIQNGNTGAVIECGSQVTEANVDDEAIATAVVSGSTVTVTGVSGAVGIATVTITAGSETRQYEVPVGYTTFLFNGNTLTVYEGSDTKYEITGINAAEDEYEEGSTSYPLLTGTDDEGNSVYYNSDNYSLLVSITKKGGTYVFAGQGDDMAIAVKKEATAPATLLLCGLDLTSSFTAPITIKKNSTTTATITALAGHVNTLTDADFNNADYYGDPDDDGGDGTNVEYAESAVIKGKAYCDLTLNGTGTLNLVCNTKNAVKVGEYGDLTIEDLTLNVSSTRNGISSDNTMTIRSGDLNVVTAADGIRSDPDAVGADIGCTGNITIEGGNITIRAGSDGVQAAQDLYISGGVFDIQAGAGWNDAAFDKDTMSCKGLKASYNTDEEDDTSEATNTIAITGGTFYLNTADDAIHSDAYITITGGEYDIYTGDDGVHGDTTLILGEEGGADCAIHMTVHTCYEGLEAGTVYVYSGCYDVTASDDGVNAAGGNGGDTTGFNPGGGWGGGWGGSMGQPGSGTTTTTDSYSLNICGGLLTVDAGGDGLDSNGPLNLTGGTVIVWGCASGADAPLDCDGTLTINGATVFAAGSAEMVQNPGYSSQTYITTRNLSSTAGKTIHVMYNGTCVFDTAAAKSVGYVLYSSPDMTSTSGWTITADTAAAESGANWLSHDWDEGVITLPAAIGVAGEMTYTCTLCGGTKTEAIPALDADPDDGDETTDPSVPDETEETDPSVPDETEETEPSVPDETEETEPSVPDETKETDPSEPEEDDTTEPTAAPSEPGEIIPDDTQPDETEPQCDGGDDCVMAPYTDLDTGEWYHDGIHYCIEKSLMNGTAETLFEPDIATTRAMLVTILWRMEGSPDVSGLSEPFTDVSEDHWFYDAVVWAYSEGVVKGTSDTTFDPDADITREQVAAILYRYNDSPAVSGDLSSFADADQVSAYAVDALIWAVEQGLINGIPQGGVTLLAPHPLSDTDQNGNATRAQIATILMRYQEA